MKRKLTTYILAYLLISVLMTGCLYENPVMTADGELGIDPTEVTLKANIKLNLKMPASVEGATALERPEVGEKPSYRHRFVIDAYHNRTLAARQVIYEDIIDGRTEMSIPVSLKLHALNYEIAVWTDYVQVPNQEEDITGTEEYFYNTISNHLLTVLGSETYRANNEYKDALCGKTDIDLGEYREEWGAQITTDIELKRPLARYELVANDVTKFLKRIEAGTVKGETFTVKVKYNTYLNVGYNVLERLPRHGLMYLQYQRTIRLKDLKDKDTFPLVFDYVFAADDVMTRIPVTLEIVDGSKKMVAATTFNISVYGGKHSTTTHNFLTADPDGGIDFDPSYDGEEEIIVPGEVTKNNSK